MRFPSTAVLLLSVCALPACEQANREASPTPIQLEEEWGAALVRRDTVAFGRLLAPGFVYTENASVMSREEIIRSVTGADTVESARNEGMQVHDFGDVQVITGVLHLRGKGKDGPFDRRFQFTDTWHLRNGRWQVVAAQDYLIPK